MPHVITQSCCSDGSCVYACPVNCIHPSPDEPEFASAEMLYIDPVACVDCGACVSACPVGAIAPDSRLTTEQLPFIALNASFYPDRPGRQEAATDVQTGAGNSRTTGAGKCEQARRSVDGGHRGVRLGRHVCRRRATDPAGCAGQCFRKAAHALWIGTRRGGTGSSDHQAGDQAFRPDRASSRIPVLPQRRGRQPAQPR